MYGLAPETNPYTGAQARALHSGTLAATVTFPEFAITASRLSMGFSWTGTPTGTLKLQHFDGSNWFDTPGAAAEFTSQPAGGAGSVACNWSNVPGSKARIVYTRTSGDGTLTSNQTQGAA